MVRRAAQAAGVVIYWMRSTGQSGGAALNEYGVAMRSASWNSDEFRDQFLPLQKSLGDGGGKISRVDRVSEIERVFVQVQEELREQYVLGCDPSNPEDDRGWPRVLVTVKRSGTEVCARREQIDFERSPVRFLLRVEAQRIPR
jgi:hypothetical protein